jgi:hypothetical protein
MSAESFVEPAYCREKTGCLRDEMTEIRRRERDADTDRLDVLEVSREFRAERARRGIPDADHSLADLRAHT